ncbi:DUF3592 domain-containing protein [Microbulbifer salipaludis]|uniref:DUF3592 domain-containing protein n=1 Tax=Microbulbifer salipaludis TaxID=187980 RepID=A0ABS3E4R7_9GAMM|nr:DUF3592 domain-containing protein [Microbulbifer salipaludis]MBN8430272.1 DUF3592 domain-containing protein [Microbulbifer salipaludis]
MANAQVSRVGGSLFGGFFFLMGFGFFFGLVGITLIDRLDMRDWLPMKADILSAELKTHRDSDGDTTYKARADYQYHYNGRIYRGNRVSVHRGSDNIGSYQQNMYQRLAGAKRQERPVTGWVNPHRPAESVLDRELRWMMVLFPTMLCSVFMIIGAGIIYLTWRKEVAPDPEVENKTPWLSRQEWSQEGIYSNNRLMVGGAWFIALAVNTISLPISYVGVDHLARGKYVGLLLLLFGGFGFYVLYRAIKKTVEHHRFGRVPVVLSPFPGEIGGLVSGYLQFSRTLDTRSTFRVTLQQMKTETRRSGNKTRVSNTSLWELGSTGTLRRSPRGSRIYFAFEVPEALPPSRVRDGDGYWWNLEVKGAVPRVDFSRNYEIPVFKTGAPAPAAAHAGVPVAMPETNFTEQLEALLDVEQNANGISIRQARGKQPFAWPLTLFGLLFGCIGIGIGFTQAPILFPIVFTAFGILFAVIGVNLLVTGYETLIGRDRVVHRVYRRDRQKTQTIWPRKELRGLCLRRSGSGSSRGKTTEYFDLLLQNMRGETLSIGCGIAGRLPAQQLLESVGMLTGLDTLDEYKHRIQLKKEQAEF